MQTHLANTMSLCSLKLLWLHRVNIDNASYSVDIVDPIDPPRHVCKIIATADQLRTHQDGFLTDIRRSLINDLYLTVSRFGVITKNMILGIVPPEPEFHKQAHEGEVSALCPYLSKEDKKFLEFFRRLRNSTVHYDGNHNLKNSLDYEFNGTHSLTTEGNLGTQITFWFSDLFAMHERLISALAPDAIMANRHLQEQISGTNKSAA